jgi:plastocyanin domain-containing protein
MSRLLVIVAVVVAAACSKDSKPADRSPDPAAAKAPAASAATVAADGLRHIPVEASDKGYSPDRIAGKPGEKLVLSVTRTSNSECMQQIKTPDGTLVDLPLGKATDVAMVVPKSGEATFTCGMGMASGTIVSDSTL